ncbi:MAG: tetratricopeptide repeat protein [candidate division Zixibacteria bacterium]|nr:tetratricopeptide repeat protein [candidate division Zixibacteria bacterium]
MTKQKNTKKVHSSSNSYYNLFVTYYCTIGLFVLGWAVPEVRVWGFNWWAYQSTIIQILLVLIAGCAVPLLWLWSKHIKNKAHIEISTSGTSGKYWTVVTVTLISLASFYYVFPSTTHFLGDGYYLLTRLEQEVGSLKSWDIGASLVNDIIFNALGGQSEENALLTFRIISVSSGLLMLIIVALISYKLFERFMDRILFFVGIASGGYTLHFFGYVENYALLVLMFITFTLLGLLATLRKTSRWLTVIPALLACVLHIFGLILLPALLYILLFDREPLVRISLMSRRKRLYLIIVFGIIALSTYFFLFYNYYFFRFAFLPFVPDRFTVDDNYLLSPKHIVDFINLLILLVPGVGIFLAEVIARHRKRLWNRPDIRYLLLLLATSIVCIYLFNPGHGMPRNWDLFSLPGIPLSVIVFYTLLSNRQPSRRRLLSVSMAITLGFLLLAPRVLSQWIPKIAIMHFKNYVELDRTRNRNARSLLTNYYRTIGDEVKATMWHNLTVESFPEARLTNRGKQMLKSGNIDQAKSLFVSALQINPIFVDAYSNLGTCYIYQGRLEKALEFLEIADGLNPLNASIINNKGTVFLRLGDFQRAEDQFHKSLRIDRSNISAMTGMISVNVQRKDDQLTSEYLEMVRNSSGLSIEYFKQGVEVCMEAGLPRSAQLAFDIAVELDASRTWQQNIIAKYPTIH